MATESSSERERVSWAALIALCVTACLVGIFDRDLWTPDEPRVAAVSLEMSRSGNVLVPHLAGQPFVEHPPLYYATASSFIRGLGPLIGNAAAIRLTSAMWGLAALAVTFLLAQRLLDRGRALYAAVLLATMGGFVEHTHWIRVDSALIFFVTASLWCFAEVYFGGRRWFCLPAALFAAGAFLTKGLVGPVFIAVGWLGLVAAWTTAGGLRNAEDVSPQGFDSRRHAAGFGTLILPHVLCTAVFALIAGWWVYHFRAAAGPDLWHDWFWVNHVGRLRGTTPQLGHLQSSEPLYYLKTVAVYSLPWLPLIAVWILSLAGKAWRLRRIPPADLFLLLWAALMILLLSLSATKRDLYLAPLLPALAIMCASALHGGLPRWCKAFFALWFAACLLLLAGLSFTPLWMNLFHPQVPGKMAEFLASWGAGHAIAAVGLVVCLYVALRRIALDPRHLVMATAFTWIAILAVAGGALDREKSMEADVRSFACRIPTAARSRVGGWNLSETTRACFYFYCDWPVSRIADRQRMLDVVGGADRDFDSVVVTIEGGVSDLPEVPYRLLAQGSIGAAGRKRELLWLAPPGRTTGAE